MRNCWEGFVTPERLKIVRFHVEGAKNVTEIAAMLDTTVVNVSHHLTVLIHAGLIKNQKKAARLLFTDGSRPPG